MILSNPKAVVTEERLNEYHQTILPYLGGMPNILANKFVKGDLYSTDEKMIGQWTNGKPIYQRVFTNVNLPAVSDWTVLNDSVSYESLISCRVLNSNSSAISYNTFDSIPRFNISDAKLKYYTSEAFSSMNLCIQYTKTSDSAVAIGNDTDYSTTEKIVGTWIDGKRLYQKTVEGNISAGWSNIAHNISNVDTIYISEGFVQRSDKISRRIGGSDGTNHILGVVSPSQISVHNIDSTYNKAIVTLQYTKTTD